MTTGVWWLDALIGMNIAVMFWNLLFMMCVYAENQQLKRKKEEEQ